VNNCQLQETFELTKLRKLRGEEYPTVRDKSMNNSRLRDLKEKLTSICLSKACCYFYEFFF